MMPSEAIIEGCSDFEAQSTDAKYKHTYTYTLYKILGSNVLRIILVAKGVPWPFEA